MCYVIICLPALVGIFVTNYTRRTQYTLLEAVVFWLIIVYFVYLLYTILLKKRCKTRIKTQRIIINMVFTYVGR